MSTLRDKILACEDLPTTDLEVPHWGGVTVRLRGMAPMRAIEFEEVPKNGNVGEQMRAVAKMLSGCLLDPETNAPIFTDPDELLRKSTASITWLASQVQELNASPLEVIKQNLEPTPDSESTPK